MKTNKYIFENSLTFEKCSRGKRINHPSKKQCAKVDFPVFQTISILIFVITTAGLFTSLVKFSPNPNSVTGMQIDTSSEQLIFRGQLVEVYVEKAIYHSPTSINFFMKFSIKNIGSKTIGLDLTNYQNVFYPNQWGFYNKPYREIIDEEMIIPDTTINKTEILKKFKDNSLTMITPNETIEYYRHWNGSGEKIESKNEEYLIISIDGQLTFTDGEQCKHLTLNDAEESKRVVVLSHPIYHKTIPENSLIINQ